MHSREEMDETFIVVSHDMDFVRDICDRLALMRAGKIVQIGKTADVLAILTEEEKQVMNLQQPPA
jgi:methyl coenzyme M reductase system subunit A2